MMERTNENSYSTLQAQTIMMTEEQIKALDAAGKQLRRGVLELCVLSAIAAEDEIYSSTIQEKLKDTPLEVKEGTLYPLLTRLKNSQLLQYTWRESTSGPPRKYFSITDDGREFLDGLMSTWSDLVSAVHHNTQNNQTNE
ncbi:MAG: PadR family transcriptional regulator [Lewinella sp.]|jgi:PadR family transcriptional regulator PadR|uniref:PadR family transcriptional regulator n=1 Tax=Lewinella TaxID=70994 RepID=UPI000360C752|nr:PadR family transcriptional regulator [Lewinella cohaerens]